MLNEIKIMLGERASNYSDEQITLAYKRALSEVENYCKRIADIQLEEVADEIAIIKLNRMGSEGLQSQSYSGVSENYLDGYPAHIKAVLDSKRKMKTL